MLVANTKENRSVRDVIVTMAIENMYVSEEFVKELLKVGNGEKSSEELRQEVIKRYKRKETQDEYGETWVAYRK